MRRLIAFAVLTLGLLGAACSHPDREPAVPRADTARALPLGIPNARFFADGDVSLMIAEGQRAFERELATLRAEGKNPTPANLPPVAFVCSDAHKDVGVVKDLYESLIDAKQKCGESTEGLSFPQFHRLVASKSDGLKERHGCERVRFLVAVENGHVSFKAKAD